MQPPYFFTHNFKISKMEYEMIVDKRNLGFNHIINLYEKTGNNPPINPLKDLTKADTIRFIHWLFYNHPKLQIWPSDSGDIYIISKD